MPIPIALLLPLIPPMIEGVMQLVSTIRNAPETSEAQRAQLDAVAGRLEAAKRAVADAPLPAAPSA